jgi:CheY-like chemotaxis protein
LYSFRTSFGPADLAFTDRYGGVSASPYDELNLSVSGPDDPEAKAIEARMLAGGCDGYLSKPVDVPRFAAQVRGFLKA